MANPSNWLDEGYDLLELNGVPLTTQRSTLNVVTGSGISATLVDDDVNDVSVLTLTAGAGAPVAVVTITASTVVTSPSVNTYYVVKSSSGSGPITLTIAGTAVDGVEITVYDFTKNFATYNFTFQCQSGWTAVQPEDVGAANIANPVLKVNGESATWKADAEDSTWLY
jgi:hypothetical protein